MTSFVGHSLVTHIMTERGGNDETASPSLRSQWRTMLFGLSPKQFTMRRRKPPRPEKTVHFLNGEKQSASIPSSGNEHIKQLSSPPAAAVASVASRSAARTTPDDENRLTFAIAKWAILRSLGAIYFIAFLGAYQQNEGLMGSHGLVPAEKHMEWMQGRHSWAWEGFIHFPALFWWTGFDDNTMYGVIWAGMILSGAVIAGVNSWLIQLALWLLQFSIVTISGGTSFYNYGWESQILETGFLAIFLCALPYASKHNGGWTVHVCWWESNSLASEAIAPSRIILWLFRWLSFRISLGAGLIKVRGGSCWADKTCLHYHFETQPLPSPLSFVYHFLSKEIQAHMVDVDLWVQLYTSWFVLLPMALPGNNAVSVTTATVFRTIVRVGGIVQAGFMVGIALSGNFSFLNHLTIIPALACLDDACWPAVFHRWVNAPLSQPLTPTVPPTANVKDNIPNAIHTNARGSLLSRRILDLLLLLVIGYLSWPVVANLLQHSGHQMMNASFGSFRLVNTYGAFGTVGHDRYEPIVSISDDGVHWREVEFPCKPGKVTRRPCFVAPYHYRADWNIWFIGFKPHVRNIQGRERWVVELLQKLLTPQKGPRPWLHLLDATAVRMLNQYYDQEQAPMYAKVDMYHYKMAASLSTILWRWAVGRGQLWWKRTLEEPLIQPVQLNAAGSLAWAEL